MGEAGCSGVDRNESMASWDRILARIHLMALHLSAITTEEIILIISDMITKSYQEFFCREIL